MILPLKNIREGENAFIDESDYEDIKHINWRVLRQARDGYTTRYVYATIYKDGDWHKPKTIYLHRIITNCPPNKVIDHKNGDGLDNRRSNIQVCDLSTNAKNRIHGRARGFKWSP